MSGYGEGTDVIPSNHRASIADANTDAYNI